MDKLSIRHVEIERMLKSRHEAQFALECLRVYAQISKPNLQLPPSRAQMRHMLDTFRSGNRIIAAVDEYDDVAGLASYYNGENLTRIGWLHGIAVEQRHRRQRVGEHMLDYILTDMRFAGARECRLEAVESAVGFYERYQFEDIDSSDDPNRLMRYQFVVPPTRRGA